MRVLDLKDREILALAQGDLPVEERPFDVWAKQLGMDVDELLERLKKLKQEGIIRDIKGVLRHHKAGFSSNAMVIWAVPEDRIDEIGEKIAGSESVSHCYERPGFGKYNVFSMVHGRSDFETSQLISELASATGIDQYKVFWSVQELKKSSMKYF
jgi:DNA-binding Lrp family transcriptional regulator